MILEHVMNMILVGYVVCVRKIFAKFENIECTEKYYILLIEIKGIQQHNNDVNL